MLLSVWSRAFLLNASWNYSLMQNPGFVWSLFPLVRRLSGFGRQASALLTRHVDRFSTHPYLMHAILGSVVALEERCEGKDCSEAVGLKKALAGPYSAIGDPFFNGALRPFIAVAGLVLAFCGEIFTAVICFAVLVLMLCFFRLAIFLKGYGDAQGAMQFIRNVHFPEMAKMIRAVTLLLICAYCAFFSVVPEGWIPLPGVIPSRLAITAVVVGMYYLIRKGVSQLAFLYVFSACATGIGFIE